MTWSEMQPLLEQASWDTLYMVGWSTVIAVLLGLPLGILLVLTDRGGLLQNSVANKVIGQIVNIARSMPFIILMVALMGFTRWLTGTTIGREAAIVPLAIGAIPFFARLVETSVREVDSGLVEAVQSMGGSTWTVVRKVLVPESLPSMIAGVTTTIVTLIGYSAMVSTVGSRRPRRHRHPLRLPALRVRPDVDHRRGPGRRHLPHPVRWRLRRPGPAPPGRTFRRRTQAALPARPHPGRHREDRYRAGTHQGFLTHRTTPSPACDPLF